tara:strand:+ start:1600 stop:1773 length:174 start_codon:yes stop_codon:yes gene_type:complete
MKAIINNNMKDTAGVLAANGGVIGLSFSACNEVLLFVSTILAIAFTLYKFYKLSKNK